MTRTPVKISPITRGWVIIREEAIASATLSSSAVVSLYCRAFFRCPLTMYRLCSSPFACLSVCPTVPPFVHPSTFFYVCPSVFLSPSLWPRRLSPLLRSSLLFHCLLLLNKWSMLLIRVLCYSVGCSAMPVRNTSHPCVWMFHKTCEWLCWRTLRIHSLHWSLRVSCFLNVIHVSIFINWVYQWWITSSCVVTVNCNPFLSPVLSLDIPRVC